jgi:hypothetical protein
VDVAPDRLPGWCTRFAERHGATVWTLEEGAVVGAAADGAVATCEIPFPPLVSTGASPEVDLAAHAQRHRTVGALLVRSGGFAAAVYQGDVLGAGQVGRRRVQGRSAAGGWSQQRFARRRDGQAHRSRSAAADLAAEILLPATLDALVLGGDRASVAEVLTDPRLAPLVGLAGGRFLAVPDPRMQVLVGLPARFRAVHVRLVEPGASLAPAP